MWSSCRDHWMNASLKFTQSSKPMENKRNLPRGWQWRCQQLIKPRRWWSLHLWPGILWSHRCNRSRGGTAAQHWTRWSGTAGRLKGKRGWKEGEEIMAWDHLESFSWWKSSVRHGSVCQIFFFFLQGPLGSAQLERFQACTNPPERNRVNYSGKRSQEH